MPSAPIVYEVPDEPDEKEATTRLLHLYPKQVPGRPTLLTPEVEGRFLGMLMKGVYRNVAAQACGLKVDTVEKWMKRGRGRLKDRPPTPEYVMFVRRVEQAEAMARGQVESNIVRRSKYDHNAGLSWLRTRYPDQWPRFPGGVEEEGPENPFRAPTAPPMETPEPIRQQTNILVLSDDKWSELAHSLIAQNRKVDDARRTEQAEAIEEQYEDRSDDAPRHSRLDRLRTEE